MVDDSKKRVTDSRKKGKRNQKFLRVKNIVCSLFIAHCTLHIACTADPDPTLNYKDREIVDSLFRKQIDTLKVYYDSLCEMRFDSAVLFKTDSIMKVRESEIKRYLERIKKETNGE